MTRVPSASTMLSPQNLDALANRLLDRLRGYSRRQDWIYDDKEVLSGILGEWDRQVKELQYQLRSAELMLREAQSLNRQYERKLVGRQWGSYLKFLFGVNECPSQ